MIPRDTAAVLGILAAAWPNQTITEQTAAVWREMLADVDQSDAMAAARTLVKRSEWFPSIAQFRNEAEANAHARCNRAAASRGLGSGHKPTSPPPRLIAAARQLLAEQRGARHWHGGPDLCPVCGGITTSVSSHRKTTERPPRPSTSEPLNGCGINGCRTCKRDQP